MRKRILLKLSHWHSTHPWRMLLIVILITLLMTGFSSQLSITMNMRDLLPEGDPKLDEFNRIIDEFQTATSLLVVLQGPEQEIKAFADDLAPRIPVLRDTVNNQVYREELRQLRAELPEQPSGKRRVEMRERIDYLKSRIDRPLFQRVDYKSHIDFLKQHAMMLVDAEDLENTQNLFTDPNLKELLSNLNDSMEKEYVGREESISTREKEDGAVQFLDGIESLTAALQEAARGEELTADQTRAVADKLLFGDPYMLSYDKTTLVMNAVPNFTVMDRDLLMQGYVQVQQLLNKLSPNYPGVQAGLSGDIAREHDEQIYSQQSLQFTSLIAFAAILALLVISFRMWSAPILAGINLLVGLIWAMGATWLAVGQLNMVTAMFAVVLLGLGIDFSIHMITGFTEWRAAGENIENALSQTFIKNGKGIITGAVTTACAFLALLISRSQGMKEMGIVTGSGLIAVLLATFIFLPAVLVLRERARDRRREKKGVVPVQRDITFRQLGSVCRLMGKHYGWTLLIAALLSGLMIWSASQIRYDKNYMNMEPEGLESIALMDTITEKFDLSMEYALCLADSVAESRRLADAYEDLGTVSLTSDISVYLPSPQEQAERRPYLRDIRERMRQTTVRNNVSHSELPGIIEEIERLEMNIMEMQDMAYLGGQDKVDNKCSQLAGTPNDPDSRNRVRELLETLQKENITAGLSNFQQQFAPYFKSTVLNMCSADAITLNDLPESVLDQFSNPDRSLFLVTIYPSGSLFQDADVLDRFVDDVNRVEPATTGTPVVAIVWMRVAGRDGRNAVLLTLLIIFLILWLDFGRIRYALMAMLPLALGAVWMIGIMYQIGMMMNFMTLVGIPLIIGIGIDDGVHVVHRWQIEGPGRLYTVFSSTGKAILLTSLTTMLAFGSMTFSVFPAWAWFGESLAIGVGACFVTTVLVLSGIIGWMERGKGK